MSPFGAVSRNRGSRNPVAYNSTLKPGGTMGCTSGGRSATRGRLIERTFELGGGKSCTVILRLTPGAACPVAHRCFTGEDRAFFSGCAGYDGDDENSCEENRGENRTY